jgi:hypothetical protein
MGRSRRHPPKPIARHPHVDSQGEQGQMNTQTTPEKETYNGWTNWATWHVALLIDNEQESHNRQWTMAKHSLTFLPKNTFSLAKSAAWWKKTFAKQARETNQFAKENWNETAGFINWEEIAGNAIEEAALDSNIDPELLKIA